MNDYSHCGPNGFSPPAPPEYCALQYAPVPVTQPSVPITPYVPPEVVHEVSEPSTLLLVAAAILFAALVKKAKP